MEPARVRLGTLLVEARIISPEQLDRVLDRQRADGRRLGTLLVETGLVSETQVTQILSQQLSVPWVSLFHIEFTRQLLNLVPRGIAERFCVIPIFVRDVRGQGLTLYIAMDDPTNEDALRACIEAAGLPVRPMIAAPSEIRSAIRAYYGGSPSSRPMRASRPAFTAPLSASGRQPAPPPVAANQDELIPVDEPLPFEIPVTTEPTPTPNTAGDSARPGTLPFGPPKADQPVEQLGLADAIDEDLKVAMSMPPPDTAPVPERPAEPPIDVEIAARPASESPGDEPEAPRKRRGARMVSVTLLDGTTVALPAARAPRPPSDAAPAVDAADVGPASDSGPRAGPGGFAGDQLTARDIVAALRAEAQGVDASEILGDVGWERFVAALLGLLLRKRVIADWEFVEELRRKV